MNGREFKNELAKKCRITQHEAGTFLKAFTDLIKRELSEGNSITFTGLGKFYTVPYKREFVITPKGDRVEVEPHNVVRFTPCKELKNKVAGRV